MSTPCAARPCPRHLFQPDAADCDDLSPAEIEQLRADAASVERLATVLPLAAHVARGTRALAEQLGRTAHMLGLEVAARGGRSERRQAEQDAVAAQGGVREHASAYTPFVHPDRVPDGEPFTGCGRCRNRAARPGEAARPYHAPGCPEDAPAQPAQGRGSAMTAIAKPGTPDAAEADRRVTTMLHSNRDVLCAFARGALAKGHTGADMLLVCIPVDSEWRWLVEGLMPGYEWEALRARKSGVLMCVGARSRSKVVRLVVEHGIHIRPQLQDPPPPPGAFWVVACTDSGLSLALLQVDQRPRTSGRMWS